MQGVAAFLLLPAAALAGCLAGPGAELPPGAGTVPEGPHLGLAPLPQFTLPKIVDGLRAGGEPVIAVTPKGSLIVSAHPGYTHYHPDPSAVPPTGPELVVPSQGQSYLWRSTDNGGTWTHVGLLPSSLPNTGPRGVGQGVSDPDLTVDARGRIYLTDLEALASASVSWSDDDGQTWLLGNDLASGGFVDRQWLASYGTTVYFRGNGLNDVRRSTDGGLTWENLGNAGCGGDILANPADGRLYVACGLGFSMSTDGGFTWDARRPPGVDGGGGLTEVALDAAGAVYVAAESGEHGLDLAWTADDGATWRNLTLAPYFPELANGTFLWPWTSAGSAGRVSVTFYGSPTADAQSDTGAEWFVYNLIVLGADTDAPSLYPSKLTPEPFHKGAICRGTGCQATTAVDDASDRRLGDFFETTIDASGLLHVVYTDTEHAPSDSIGHVGYVRLVDGPRLVDGTVPKGFPTQG